MGYIQPHEKAEAGRDVIAILALIKARLNLIMAGVIVVLLGIIYFQSYKVSAVKAEMALAKEKAKAAQQAQLDLIITTNKSMVMAEVFYLDALDRAIALSGKPITKILERAVHADPKFSECKRSDELHSERLRQLSDIRKAIPNRVQ